VLLSDVSSPADTDLWVRKLYAQVRLHNRSSNQPYQLAFSVGVAVFDPAAPKTVEELMHLADEAMYSARNARRGVVPTTNGGDAMSID
jgi:GGDEF domain-containing protein